MARKFAAKDRVRVAPEKLDAEHYRRTVRVSRFRGAGLGKHSYVATDGHNPTRAANGGRI